MSMAKEAPGPAHHPSLETLTAYVAGALRPGFDLVVAAHVRGCAVCRAEVRALESVGGAMLAEAPELRLDRSALERTMARLDEPAPAAPARTLDDLLSSAKRRWVAPGVWVAKVHTPHAKGDRVYMLRAAPGVATARHAHDGAEFTQVLHGALEDDGIVYRAGDFTEREGAHTHHPRAHGDEPCICLFATEGRLAAAGMIGRLAFAWADV
jgi:putative transcriptional regulator